MACTMQAGRWRIGGHLRRCACPIRALRLLLPLRLPWRHASAAELVSCAAKGDEQKAAALLRDDSGAWPAAPLQSVDG